MKKQTDKQRDALYKAIVSGDATDEQIAEYIGTDMMNRLEYQTIGDFHSRNDFYKWYEAVLKPLDIDFNQAYKMFIGQISIAEFTNGLSEEQADKFREEFPQLQQAYQKTIQWRL